MRYRAILACFVGTLGCGHGRSAPQPPTAKTAEDADEAEVEEEALVKPHTTSTSRAMRDQSSSCAAGLDACEPNGCEDEGSPHALFNNIKRRTTTSGGSPITFESSTPIDFKVMKKLQKHADDLVGQHVMPDESERKKLASIDVDGLQLGEGAAVRIIGYLAPHTKPSAGVHAGGIESVNCRLTKEDEKDIHIPLVPAHNADECAGVVVEMIPQGRAYHPHWNRVDLVDVGKTNVKVMFVGPLFYDSEHLVNDDCAHLKNGQPKRMSLWEVHPVIEVYECDEGSCSVDSKAGWTRIE